MVHFFLNTLNSYLFIPFTLQYITIHYNRNRIFFNDKTINSY